MPPELPPGWYYTEDLERDDLQARARRRKRVVLAVVVAAALVVGAAIAGTLLWTAQRHYSDGVAALEQGSYPRAIVELSAAQILGISYRDAAALEDQARRELVVQDARREEARARAEGVGAALVNAAAAFEQRNAGETLAALEAVSPADLRDVVRDDAAVRRAAVALAGDLTAAAQRRLQDGDWDKAGRWVAALLVLDPSSEEAARLKAKVELGRELSERLAEAQAAARSGEWRKALRLAQSITAVREGFPGAAALIADARAALRPKPVPTLAAATPTPTSTSPPPSGGSTVTPPAPPPP